MAINSRSKGQRGEREVRDLLQKVMDDAGRQLNLLFVPEVKRNLMQSMQGGHDLVNIPGLAVEVKFQENLQVDKWWEQCLRQAGTVGNQPVLIYRKKNAKWKVRMWAQLPGEFSVAADFTADEFLLWFDGYLTAYWRANPPSSESIFSDKNV